jgi:hypothetical protein
MSNIDKSLSDAFNINPIGDSKNDLSGTKSPVLSTHYKQADIEEDLNDAYQQSKENLQGILDQGKDAMEEILNIAKAGQHPRAFEVYATLLKNMTEANDRLLKIQKEMREMDKKKEVNNTNIDKAIFVGSTAELGKLLKGKKDEQ